MSSSAVGSDGRVLWASLHPKKRSSSDDSSPSVKTRQEPRCQCRGLLCSKGLQSLIRWNRCWRKLDDLEPSTSTFRSFLLELEPTGPRNRTRETRERDGRLVKHGRHILQAFQNWFWEMCTCLRETGAQSFPSSSSDDDSYSTSNWNVAHLEIWNVWKVMSIHIQMHRVIELTAWLVNAKGSYFFC